MVAQGRVFYVDAQNGRETLHVVRIQDGSELWRADIDAVMHDEQGPDGPRGTPLVVGEQVFYQSCLGELQCRRVSDGQLVWRTNFQKDFGSPWKGEDSPIPGASEHGYTASPVWSDGRLMVNVGATNGAGIVAFEAATGAVLWKSQNDSGGVCRVGGGRRRRADPVDRLCGRGTRGDEAGRWFGVVAISTEDQLWAPIV